MPELAPSVARPGRPSSPGCDQRIWISSGPGGTLDQVGPLFRKSSAFGALVFGASLVVLAFGGAPVSATKAPPQTEIAFANPSYSGDEGSVAAVTVERSSGAGTTKVRLTTSNATAIAGTDYVGVNTTISFKSGQTLAVVNITIPDDMGSALVDQFFYVTLSNNSTGTFIGNPSIQSVTITEDSVPPVPQNVFATLFNTNEVNLTWSVAAGATSYVVQRACLPVGSPPPALLPWVTIGTPTANGFVDTNLPSDSNCEYDVASLNDDGQSVESAASGVTTGSF